jgi:threonine synthase
MVAICSECEAPLAADRPCACGGLPEFRLRSPRMSPHGYKNTLKHRRVSSDPRFRSGVWRYIELLPPIQDSEIVSMAEGNVPLYESAGRGEDFAEVRKLAYLHLGMNPTGSFKDLGMTVAVSAAKASGMRSVACASTGNTAASMAAYAARGGLRSYALVPRNGISREKLAQIRDYGAEVVEVQGSFDDAFARLAELDAVAIVNSVNPYRIEGQKCAAFAMLEARGWCVPDWVVLPGGNLGNVSAIGKGLLEAHALGLIGRLPRIAVIQASGAAPFVHAWEHQVDLVPCVAQTMASAIAIGNPKSWRRARRILKACNGTAISVSDAEIDRAKGVIGLEGIGCEPASASSLAGLRELVRRGIVDGKADVVTILTGHVLKDGAASVRVADLRDVQKARGSHACAI